MTATLIKSDGNPYRWVLLAGVWAVYFSFGVTIASLAPLITPVGEELGLSKTTMGAVLASWPFVYIAAAIPCGILVERLGARTALFIAACLMASSGLVRAQADGAALLFLAGALFGLGGPLVSVGAPTLIARLFEGAERGSAMGIYITGPYLGSIVTLSLTNSVLMPFFGGDWRTVLTFISAFVICVGLAWLLLARQPAAKALLAQPGDAKTFDPDAFSDILKSPEVRIVLAMAVGVFFINHGMNNWLVEILRAHGLSAERAGFWAAVPAAIGVIGALVIPRYATPERRLWIMAALVASAFVASVLIQSNEESALITGLFLQGVARSSLMTVTVMLLMEARDVPKDRLGLAGGVFFTVAEIGGVLGPFSFGLLLDLSGTIHLPLGAISLAALILGLLLVRLRALHARA